MIFYGSSFPTCLELDLIWFMKNRIATTKKGCFFESETEGQWVQLEKTCKSPTNHWNSIPQTRWNMSKLVANPLFQVLYQTELEWGLMKKLCGLVLVPSLKLMQMGHFQPKKKSCIQVVFTTWMGMSENRGWIPHLWPLHMEHGWT